jgi:hypothetical protein
MKAISAHPILLARNMTFLWAGRDVLPFIRTQPVANCSFIKTTGAAGANSSVSGAAVFREGKLGRLVWRPAALLRYPYNRSLVPAILCRMAHTVSHQAQSPLNSSLPDLEPSSA